MQLFTYFALLIIGGVFGFFKRSNAKNVHRSGIAYVLIGLLVSGSCWLLYINGVKDASVIKYLSIISLGAGAFGYLILGYLVSHIAIALTSAKAYDFDLRKIVNLTLWGVAVSTGFSFITESCWKAENICKMTTFFTNSGYSAGFLYFIMIAEAIGGLGLLLHFKLKTGPAAAAGLMLIMIGALYTHRNNNDPLSSSYEAITQFVTLGIMQLIYYFEMLTNPRSSSYVLTVNEEINRSIL